MIILISLIILAAILLTSEETFWFFICAFTQLAIGYVVFSSFGWL